MKIKEFFQSGLGIALAVIASLGILAIVGYNFWGWFGGSDKWKAEHSDNTVGVGAGEPGGGNAVVTGGRYSNNPISNQEQSTTSARISISNPIISNAWSYESVKPTMSLTSWILEGYTNNPVGKKLHIGDSIHINPPSKNNYKISNITTGSTKDTVQIDEVTGKPYAPPAKGTIEKITLVQPVNPNIFNFLDLSNTGGSIKLIGKIPPLFVPKAGQPVNLRDNTHQTIYPKNQFIWVQSGTYGNSYFVEIKDVIGGQVPPNNIEGNITW